MYLNKLIFTILGKLISKFSSIEKILRNYNKSLRIVYYHMITDKKHDYYFDNKSINQKEFYRHIKFLKKRYEIISLKEAFYKIDNKKSLDNKLIITFDDGFKENHSTIAPILDDLNVPAAFFFISNCIDNKDLMWRNKLLLIENNKDSNQYNYINDISDINKIHRINRNQSLLEWSLNCWPMNLKEKLVNDLWSKNMSFSVKYFLEKERPYCTSSQIKDLYENNFEVGTHSMSHPLFSKINYNVFCEEIVKSSKVLSNIIKNDISYFSYPFGIRSTEENEKRFLASQDKIKTLLGIKNHLNNNNNNSKFWERDNLEFKSDIMISRFYLLPILRKIIYKF